MSVDLSRVEALLFDLGGVVIDIDFARVTGLWAQRGGIEPSVIGSRFSMDLAFRQHEVGLIGDDEYFESLRRSLAIDLSDQDFIDGWLAVHVGLVEGVDDVLARAAQSWPLFGFTNSNPLHQDAVAVRFAGALSHFDTVFCSCEIGLRKPDRAAFEFVAEQIGVSIGRILFFDDSAENIQGAHESGMPAVLVRSIDDIRSALRLGARPQHDRPSTWATRPAS